MKNELNNCPAMDFFMNEDISDVVFTVEGQRLPALKIFLSMKNRVFRAMFSDNFKESKDKTVVIEETTFEAFKTMILFLYSDRLIFEDESDVNHIEDVFILSDRYEAIRLMRKTIKKLTKIEMTYDNFEQISRIAFSYKIEELISKLKTNIDLMVYPFKVFFTKLSSENCSPEVTAFYAWLLVHFIQISPEKSFPMIESENGIEVLKHLYDYPNIGNNLKRNLEQIFNKREEWIQKCGKISTEDVI